MKTYSTVNSIQAQLSIHRKKGKSISFVPTMGALHEGHLSLIRLAQSKSDIVVCSIFVNPAQFNNPEDLLKYPRSLEQDSSLLLKAGCHVLFTPTVEEIYPAGLQIKPKLVLGNADKIMEGHFRPGHFDGMLMVVKRLLDIIQPEFLIMGQKDFQQFTLVSMMINQLQLPYRLVIGETLREADGLAMSSRNRRLTPEFRLKSVIIYKSLQFCRKSILSGIPLAQVQKECIQQIENEGLRTEYFEIVDGKDCSEVVFPGPSRSLVACVAAWAGEVRLIDNLMFKT